MQGKETLQKLISERVIIGDGATGTMLYQKGVFVNRCFEELNLTNPQMVQQLHLEYIAAGAYFIEPHTFGANTVKLKKFGLADKLEQIIEAGVSIAKQAAQKAKTQTDAKVLVAGSIGPLGSDILASLGDTQQLKAVFTKNITALVNAGVDFLLFETFSNVDELTVAVNTAQQICSLPIVAQIAIAGSNEAVNKDEIVKAVSQISQIEAVTVVGFNCAVGPAAMLEALKIARELTDKPISVQPNAGFPKDVDGRSIYMCTPEYMAEYAKRFYENGAKIIGGCCGTTPQHIKQIALAVKAMDKAMGKHAEQKASAVIADVKAETSAKRAESVQAVEPVSLEEKSLLGKRLAKGRQVLCIEITPPRGVNVEKIIQKAKMCKDHGIDFINIPDGPRASSRLSASATAYLLKAHAAVEPIVHICCRDKNLIALQSELLAAEVMGLHNVLMITGDPPKLGEYPDATAVFDVDSIGLCSIASRLNRGTDVVGNELGSAVKLVLGVGANPVASQLQREIERFRKKAAAGAEFAITQPVFDVKMFFEFAEAVKDTQVPIIAGIWPFTSYKNAEFMANEVPGVIVPTEILHRMSKTSTRQEGLQEGVLIARQMIEQLQGKVAGFAVSAPFGNVKAALAVLGKIAIEQL